MDDLYQIRKVGRGVAVPLCSGAWPERQPRAAGSRALFRAGRALRPARGGRPRPSLVGRPATSQTATLPNPRLTVPRRPTNDLVGSLDAAAAREPIEQERADIYHENGALYYGNHRLEKGSQIYVENRESGRYACTITAINNSEVRSPRVFLWSVNQCTRLTAACAGVERVHRVRRCGCAAPTAPRPSCTYRSCAWASTSSAPKCSAPRPLACTSLARCDCHYVQKTRPPSVRDMQWSSTK